MIGSADAGLAETIEYVLKLFTPNEQQRLVDNIFLTGGCANYPGKLIIIIKSLMPVDKLNVSKFAGLENRLVRELREIRPFESTFKMRTTKKPSAQDAWHGARKLALDATQLKQMLTTKEDYDEMGGEYLREHRWGNSYHPTPAPIVVFDPQSIGNVAPFVE